mmetsp:Transcript_1011/g.1283  ORF Transcript_1011/g.1283 Transcript_1011/m.1283 type:complete len:209 (-) Transcript_1011:209-835(-)|eukprot:CAMPEP_0204856108 /NCGR_PEP_ID=MMETSP1347-20130617/17779_1 /ASSEMBLY_ACC=CAM_ASM_000690 /TAXON_ID=215587 /ORGANISM="Aplanochytrium stocchinoi, Strain GSBS06" /LENGTH=208 /DNA_ID=CAMNT_0052002605 /DNA_START=212 /DNA_END=838 /DNA_ORIENTATION=+
MVSSNSTFNVTTAPSPEPDSGSAFDTTNEITIFLICVGIAIIVAIGLTVLYTYRFKRRNLRSDQSKNETEATPRQTENAGTENEGDDEHDYNADNNSSNILTSSLITSDHVTESSSSGDNNITPGRRNPDLVRSRTNIAESTSSIPSDISWTNEQPVLADILDEENGDGAEFLVSIYEGKNEASYENEIEKNHLDENETPENNHVVLA